MSQNDTELRLLTWRDGSTQSERLASAALKQFGYEELDPQAPLGGPDGSRDILCQKGGKLWVGAVYFPVGAVSFASIKRKFSSDLLGVEASHHGIVFVTNQHVTIRQRSILSKLASAKRKSADIIHVERLRVLLDSPRGYGIRAQFLRVPMSLEEQLSWFSDYEGLVASEVSANTRELIALRQLLQRQASQQSQINQSVQLLAASAGVATPDLLSSVIFSQPADTESITAYMSSAVVSLFHRLVCFDLPTEHIGILRSVPLMVGDLSPPKPDAVPKLLEELCEDWISKLPSLRSRSDKTEALADFHHRLLFIHPFVEGNGRAARAILAQQCLDLFNYADMSLMDRGDRYYRALRAADEGSLTLLMELIEPIIGS